MFTYDEWFYNEPALQRESSTSMSEDGGEFLHMMANSGNSFICSDKGEEVGSTADRDFSAACCRDNSSSPLRMEPKSGSCR